MTPVSARAAAEIGHLHVGTRRAFTSGMTKQTAIRWERTDYTDGASEILTLCQIEGETDYVIQITAGPDVGDDFVGLYDLDGDAIPLSNCTWDVVYDAPAELLAEIEQNWESGTTTVSRYVIG